jgi:histidine ammonia-lyase
VGRAGPVTTTVVTIDGSSLSCAHVAAVARQRATVAVASAGQDAARAAAQVAQEVAARQPVYGRTTGVGANHVVPLSERDRAQHGIRLLRSHAAGAGPLLAPEAARAMLVVRANQIGAGGSGVDPALMAATRALRMQGQPPAAAGSLRVAYDLADAALEQDTADRPLDNDLLAAHSVLDEFAAMDTARVSDTESR